MGAFAHVLWVVPPTPSPVTMNDLIEIERFDHSLMSRLVEMSLLGPTNSALIRPTCHRDRVILIFKKHTRILVIYKEGKWDRFPHD